MIVEAAKLCNSCGASAIDDKGKCLKCGAQAPLKAFGYEITKLKTGSYIVTDKEANKLLTFYKLSLAAQDRVQKITKAPLEVVSATFAVLEAKEAQFKEEAETKKKQKREPEKKEKTLTSEEKKRAEELLNDPKFLDYVLTHARKKIIGEDNVVLQNFVTLVSGQTHYPISSIIMGYSGSGKNQSIRAVLFLIPEEWIFEFKATTPEAVKYIPETFSGTLIIYEAAAMRSETSTLGLRAVGEGESIETIYPMRDEETGKMTLGRAKTNAKNFLTTDSGLDIFADLYRRVLKISMNDSEELTKRVIAKKIRDASYPEGLKLKLQYSVSNIRYSESDFKNALSLLDLDAEVIVFPLSMLLTLADLATKREQKVALRTQVERILFFVKNLALIRQKNRICFKDKDSGDSYVVAGIQDVKDALQILDKSIHETISRIEKRSSDALELFITEQNIKGSKVEYDKNELAAKLKVSSVTAARLLKTLAKNGYLEENQKVKPYKYSLTASGTENKANSFVLDEIISEYTVFYQNDLKKLLNDLLSLITSGLAHYEFTTIAKDKIEPASCSPIIEVKSEKETTEQESSINKLTEQESLLKQERTSDLSSKTQETCKKTCKHFDKPTCKRSHDFNYTTPRPIDCTNFEPKEKETSQ